MSTKVINPVTEIYHQNQQQSKSLSNTPKSPLSDTCIINLIEYALSNKNKSLAMRILKSINNTLIIDVTQAHWSNIFFKMYSITIQEKYPFFKDLLIKYDPFCILALYPLISVADWWSVAKDIFYNNYSLNSDGSKDTYPIKGKYKGINSKRDTLKNILMIICDHENPRVFLNEILNMISLQNYDDMMNKILINSFAHNFYYFSNKHPLFYYKGNGQILQPIDNDSQIEFFTNFLQTEFTNKILNYCQIIANQTITITDPVQRTKSIKIMQRLLNLTHHKYNLPSLIDSLKEYLSQEKQICDTQYLLTIFKQMPNENQPITIDF